jgi:UDP-N-acetylglucosamine--N-acetylmuramyl-(pentapeptide) pyrophosphoryl-undecaprenol N-acetylglucosamine transferase
VDSYRFILSGGGTGGHIYPAIAIANELKRRYPDASFLFVGASGRMEMEKVPKAGYEIQGLWISGLQRKLSLKNLLFPFKLISSLMKASKIVRKFRPDVAIGTGGFASGPVLQVASRRGIPCLLQEQNSFAGITNKLLAAKAARICVAYDGMERFFPADKIVKTGNPVRGDLVRHPESLEAAYAYFGLEPHRATVLILGGSLGARRINQLAESRLEFFKSLGLQLLWQCGSLYHEDYGKYNSDTVKVHAFLDRMDHAYALADIIISRAGAGTVSELCLAGKPAILIPSPHVAEDHQTRNAEALVKQGAAMMVAERDLDGLFDEVFKSVFTSDTKKAALGENIKALAIPDATERIVDEIAKILKR